MSYSQSEELTLFLSREKNSTSNQNRKWYHFTGVKKKASQSKATEVWESRAKFPAFYGCFQRFTTTTSLAVIQRQNWLRLQRRVFLVDKWAIQWHFGRWKRIASFIHCNGRKLSVSLQNDSLIYNFALCYSNRLFHTNCHWFCNRSFSTDFKKRLRSLVVPVLFISVTLVIISVYFCRNIKFTCFLCHFFCVAASFTIVALKKE